jgi:ubiquinone/menaquinone biosynthesis C-methylase UbiE
MKERPWQRWGIKNERSKVLSYWRNAANQPGRRKHFYDVLRKELKLFPKGQSVKLLDFGCGTGEDTGAILEMGVEYTGTDVTPAMLKVAREQWPSITFKKDDMLASNQDDESWPVVVCNAVLPHLPMEVMGVAIGELWRVTQQLLVVRMFGVMPDGGSLRTDMHDGFIYQRMTKQEWVELFSSVDADVRVYSGTTDETRDCLVICCERKA